MKVAVASTGNNLDSEISSVFGRCPYFIIAEIENGEIKTESAIENPAKNEQRGAGIKAAQFIANQDVKTIISAPVGPNAFDIIKQVGIKVYKIHSGSVKDNLELLIHGELEEFTSSSTGDRKGGMGGGRRRNPM